MQQEQIDIGGDLSQSESLGLSSAMVTALFHKPHDRQFIIELENSILSFIQSNAESYELRPMNSYYRLLSHQIADYYNLRHALARAHESYVIIFKGEGFRPLSGKPLLQELDQTGKVSDSLDGLHQSQDLKNSRKYKILRRAEGGLNGSVSPIASESESSSIDPQSDYDGSKADLESQRVERERQYEQRKQEIFDTPHKEGLPSENDEGNSPQPYQFETSRYKFHTIDSSPPPQPRFNNNRRKKQVNHNGGNNKRNYNDNKYNHKNYNTSHRMPYNTGYMMYPTAPMGSGAGHHPMLPIVYPAPFPMDGNNGYIPPFMYQPIGNGMANHKGPFPAGYMAFPPPFPYGQHPPTYPNLPPNGPDDKFSNQGSIKPSSTSASVDGISSQEETNDQKADQTGIPANGKLSRMEPVIDEATNGIKNLSV